MIVDITKNSATYGEQESKRWLVVNSTQKLDFEEVLSKYSEAEIAERLDICDLDGHNPENDILEWNGFDPKDGWKIYAYVIDDELWFFIEN